MVCELFNPWKPHAATLSMVGQANTIIGEYQMTEAQFDAERAKLRERSVMWRVDRIAGNAVRGDEAPVRRSTARRKVETE